MILLLEDSDAERLSLAKGVPHESVISGKSVRIEPAPSAGGASA